MLLIDGVKYEEWVPEKEVEEFQPIVKKHVRDIFGNKSKYIEARRLKSKAGIGSVPDGFVIIFGDSPQWHIVEVELSSHQLYDHIVNQVGRFINGIKNPVTQKNIIDTIYQEITGSKISKVEVEEAIGSGEIHKFLTDLISLSPTLTIIIEKKTQELEEAINLLKYSPIKIVEFQTFVREGVGLSVHAHLFERLYVPEVKKPDQEKLSAGDVIGFSSITQDNINRHYINIDMIIRSAFPSDQVRFTLETDVGKIETNVAGTGTSYGSYIQRNLKKWFDAYPELKTDDMVSFTVIEPMKRYRLGIEKKIVRNLSP